MIDKIALLLFPSFKRLYQERDLLQEERNSLRIECDGLQKERDRLIVQWRAQPTLKILAQMMRHGVDLVLEIGANKGTFVQTLRAIGYTGKIISVEPLSAAH